MSDFFFFHFLKKLLLSIKVDSAKQYACLGCMDVDLRGGHEISGLKIPDDFGHQQSVLCPWVHLPLPQSNKQARFYFWKEGRS